MDGQWQQTGTQAEWDDWRITELVLTDTVPAYPELGMRVYGLRYELHTTTPENVMLAGGMYMDEDGWVGGLNTLPPVLVFHITDPTAEPRPAAEQHSQRRGPEQRQPHVRRTHGPGGPGKRPAGPV